MKTVILKKLGEVALRLALGMLQSKAEKRKLGAMDLQELLALSGSGEEAARAVLPELNRRLLLRKGEAEQ